MATFSKQRPFEEDDVEFVLFSVIGFPVKQSELLSELPKTPQKADSDCQIWARVEEFEAIGAPLSDGANGESEMETSLQVLHTVEQKLSVDCFDEYELDDDDESVELQRIGTGFSPVSILKSSAENGSQFAQRMDFIRAAHLGSEIFIP